MLAKPLKADSSSIVVSEVLRQHSELVAFLWAQRDTLLNEDPPDVKVAEEIRGRVEVNLDGLRLAGADAWPFVVEQYRNFPEKGELFAYSWLAIEQRDQRRISEALELGRAAEDDARGLIGALAWHDPRAIAPSVRDWIVAPDSFRRFVGVSACIAHDVDPRQMLVRLIQDPDAKVRGQAARLAGKVKRSDLARDLQAALDDDHQTVRFHAGWALAELGAGTLATEALRNVVEGAGPDAQMALRTLVRSGDDAALRGWMGGLMKSHLTAPIAVRGIGMLGDRSALSWLIERMREPIVSAAAGAAFVELFPEARNEKGLFSTDPADAGPEFTEYFEARLVNLPIADKVVAWARNTGILGD
ncbi:HEAT repeat domain-containing protein [Mesorhizobium sp. VK25A]|uniref:HEAT repeat domain-containing protein n=1 Tax=Mesorhizobium vachelliae TaxID=3072309 RepID=A0ABU5ACF0_9HYPH|nr:MULTISPECIES: HEAT repeat domain-containing protein [unclassified Mesorhizobium]MDX8533966.1 HEAT repeat domain-containing protein [Mesorhizobium sp. VK25D]MDX8546563.1 HEAT repeat domain-containing protein [Mesorhizobium sp. VK25A]